MTQQNESQEDTTVWVVRRVYEDQDGDYSDLVYWRRYFLKEEVARNYGERGIEHYDWEDYNIKELSYFTNEKDVIKSACDTILFRGRNGEEVEDAFNLLKEIDEHSPYFQSIRAWMIYTSQKINKNKQEQEEDMVQA